MGGVQADVSICGTLIDARGVLGEGCVNVSLDSGRIVSISRREFGEKVYRFPGYYVAPGLVDMHVHLRGLNLSYKEDEETGTIEALRAGITLVADMPNTVPRLDNPQALGEKLRALSAKSHVDYMVYAAIPNNPKAVRDLAELPIAGFKIYPEDLYGSRLEAAMAAAETGHLLVVHAEHEAALKPLVEDEENRSAHRGCWAELAAVHDAASLGARRLHITHASCPNTILAAKRLGATVDVTPHHLMLSVRGSTSTCTLRVNPPLRRDTTTLRLRQLLAEGYVDAIASDHAPHRLRERVDSLACSPGIPSLGYWPCLLFCFVASQLISLKEALALASYNPSRILGLENFYGALKPGARANILVFRLEYPPRHVPAKTTSKADNYPEHSVRCCMDVRAVFIGGEPAYSEGLVLGRPRTANAAILRRASSPVSAS